MNRANRSVDDMLSSLGINRADINSALVALMEREGLYPSMQTPVEKLKARMLLKGAEGETAMPLLVVELVPKSCWWSNVRSNVSKADWEICKRFVRSRSGDRCEICGGRGAKWPVECHEIWDYDDDNMVQTLVGLVALCPDCHEVKHLGRAEAVGNCDRAIKHLARVNGWSIDQAEQYAAWAFELWSLRSEETWTLDITFLSLLGIEAEVKDR